MIKKVIVILMIFFMQSPQHIDARIAKKTLWEFIYKTTSIQKRNQSTKNTTDCIKKDRCVFLQKLEEQMIVRYKLNTCFEKQGGLRVNQPVFITQEIRQLLEQLEKPRPCSICSFHTSEE